MTKIQVLEHGPCPSLVSNKPCSCLQACNVFSAQVYLGVLDGVRKVAVKIVNNPSPQHQKSFLHEIALLRGKSLPDLALTMSS